MGVMQPDISVTADPALLLQPASTGAVDSYFLSNDLDPNGNYAMFVLRPWKNLSEHLQAIVDAAIYVNQTHGLTPVFVALEPTRDLEINRQAAGMLPFRSFVLPAPRDEQLTIGMMQKMRVIVSMRLHALIFASSVGAPLAAISYDPKVTGFMAYLGQKHCMELADVTKDSLCALIDDAMQTAQTACAALRRKMKKRRACCWRNPYEKNRLSGHIPVVSHPDTQAAGDEPHPGRGDPLF